MGTFQVMAFTMGEQAATTNWMTKWLERKGEGGNLDGVEVNFEYLKFAEFRKANPPSFQETFILDKGEEWIKDMDKAFSMLVCTDHQKVASATYILEADEEFCWTDARRLLEGSQTIIIWEMFKDAFYYKYFPAFVRNAKEVEFMRLQQGNMSVLEYIAKFEELFMFSTIYQRNLDKNWKCIKFEGGWREDILASVGPLEIREFAALVSKSQLVEEYNKKLTDAKSNAHRKRLAPETQEF